MKINKNIYLICIQLFGCDHKNALLFFTCWLFGGCGEDTQMKLCFSDTNHLADHAKTFAMHQKTL